VNKTANVKRQSVEKLVQNAKNDDKRYDNGCLWLSRTIGQIRGTNPIVRFRTGVGSVLG
jgi:hypothetical protein